MKKFLKIISAICLCTLYLLYLLYSVSKLPMNSDGATMLLYADEVLSGNIFLSGWSLSGLTFFTTDLPFYLIGVWVFGVGLKAFHTAVFLMYSCMTFSALLVALYGIRHKWTAAMLMLATGLIPTTYALSNAFVHTGVFVLFFLAVFVCLRHEQAPKLSAIALFVITTLGVSGDTMALLLIAIPVAILCVLKAIKKPFLMFSSVLFGSIAGIFLQKVFLHLGGAELNALNHRHFIASSQIYNSIIRFFEYCLKLLNSYFFTKPVFSYKTVVFGVQLIIALFAVYVIYSSIKAAITKKETDVAISFLGIALMLVSLALILTTLNANITAGRYIGFMPLTLGIALSRCTDIFIPLENKKIKCSVWILCIALGLAGIVSSFNAVTPLNTHSRLSEFLEENKLENGYASFWDASVITGYSEGKVNVRSVVSEEGKIKPQIWFCNKEWYEDDGNFYIVRKGENPEEIKYNLCGIYNLRLDCTTLYGDWTEQLGGITYESVTKALGKPTKTLEFENYDILIYGN